MKKHPRKSKRRQNILQAYQTHLREVMGLAPQTCQNHSRDITNFLERLSIRQATGLAKLKPVDLTGYFTARSVEYQPASLRQVAGSIRHFLHFALQQGWTNEPLNLAVPKIACRIHHDLPVYLSAPQLELLVGSWDCGTADGRRNLAIGLCLIRLGLRAGEVAALTLEDLNWREGCLRLKRSKNGNPAQLPLLADVGKAIAHYVRTDRPVCSFREVFLRHSPTRPLDRHAISRVIRRGLHRCGIKTSRSGAHLLRHSLASHLVQNGASLKEVADLLRHRHLNSAAVYAHLDVTQLRRLAQPWPTEVKL